MRSDLHRVDDILGAVAKIEKYAARGGGAFFSDELFQVWVLHHLQIIGEALRSMTEEFQTRFKGFPGMERLDRSAYHRSPPLLPHSTDTDLANRRARHSGAEDQDARYQRSTCQHLTFPRRR